MMIEIVSGIQRCSRAAIIAAFFACTSFVHAEVMEGRVIGVSDGDTVTVLDEDLKRHKIRLMGIDAPEKAQAYGKRSKQHLSHLGFGKNVLVEWLKRDRYGRIVGKVFVSPTECQGCDKSVDVGLEQIRSGLAWWYRQYAREQDYEDRLAYDAAEAEAKSRGLGLWRDADPVPPWEWRHPNWWS